MSFLSTAYASDYNEILPNLYLGSIFPPCFNQQFVDKIEVCIDMIDYNDVGLQVYMNGIEPHKFKNDPNKTYHNFPIYDHPSENIDKYFDSTYQIIDNALTQYKPIYIHCYAGVSRSASIVIAYIMKKYNVPYEIALSMARQRRMVVNPNLGFTNQLKQWHENQFQYKPSLMDYTEIKFN